MQVSEYARRFNLSASLAASITTLSAWLSSILLLTILAVVAHAQHTLTTAQATASLADLIAAFRRPLLAVSVAAAAAMMISVPVSANRAKRSQGPQHLQATAAGHGADTPPAGGVSNLAAPGGVVSSVAPSGRASSKPVNDADPAASGGGEEEAAEQPGGGTMPEPSTLASNHSFASEADSLPQTLSETVDSSDGGLETSSSIADGHDVPEQQLPSAPRTGPNRKKGFFRDIDSDCLPTCRQRHFAFGPKLYEFGNHRIVGMQRSWLARSCTHRASCLRNNVTCRQWSALR